MGNNLDRFRKKSKRDIVGYPVGHKDDYEQNEMREVPVGDQNDMIVVGRYNNEFYAFGAYCPHNGAPLVEGAFRHGTIRCPWHGACYSAKTGDIEDYPGLDGIPTFKVRVRETGALLVDAKPIDFKVKSVMTPLCRVSQSLSRTMLNKNFMGLPGLKSFVIIGSGAAGFTCAVTLRQNKFYGRVIMITSDWFLPYDKTRITKDLDAVWSDLKLKNEEFYKEHDIEILRDSTVEKINFENHRILLKNDARIVEYSSLLIATGLQPKVHDIKGGKLKNVFTINSFKDVKRLRSKAQGNRVVICGSSFLALELAASLDKIARQVVVVSRSKWPYGVVLGESIGNVLLTHILTKCKNITFEALDDVRTIVGNEKNEVRRVLTLKKKTIPCEAFVLAIGGVPCTEFLEGSALQTLLTDKTIPVNKHLQTTIQGVYAAGDVVTFPSAVSVTGYATIGHWPVACKHGQVAALNMLSGHAEPKRSVLKTVPFYWTELYGTTVRYCGNGEHYNEILIYGQPYEMKFCALYRRNGVLLAGVTANADPIAAELAFDLEHHIPYRTNEHPSYILDIFPDPPLYADSYVWWKYKDEKNVAAFDASKITTLPEGENESVSSSSTDLEIEKENLRDDDLKYTGKGGF